MSDKMPSLEKMRITELRSFCTERNNPLPPKSLMTKDEIAAHIREFEHPDCNGCRKKPLPRVLGYDFTSRTTGGKIWCAHHDREPAFGEEFRCGHFEDANKCICEKHCLHRPSPNGFCGHFRTKPDFIGKSCGLFARKMPRGKRWYPEHNR